ncbi:MAG TPA: tetratricopeptide repeat protein, partial [Caulobacteraceae bacterium]|nr:tetratricopeptide repeat protein [Caulobacteraceae bacterium]
PAPAHVDLVFDRGGATAMNVSLSQLDAQARDRALKAYWRTQFDFIDISSVGAAFDAKTGEERLTMDGVAHMDWSTGYYQTDDMALGYKPDFVRDPGSDQDAPYAVDYPTFTRTTETIILPPGFPVSPAWVKSDTDLTVAGMEYHRHSSLQGHTVVLDKTERSVEPEFPAKDAPAAAEILRGLADKTVVIHKPQNYQPAPKEAQRSIPADPKTAADFIARAGVMINALKYDDAITELDHALALDPGNVVALAGRGFAHVGKGDYAAAAKDLDAAYAIDPKSPIVLRGRGLVAEGKRDYDAAAADFSAALAINAADAFSREHRAEDEYAAGEPEAALRDSALALKANPQDTRLRLVRIAIMRAQGKTDDAVAETTALAAFTDNAYDQVAAGNAFSVMGKTAEAAQAYDRALAIKPEAYIYLNRAQNRPKTDVAGRRADYDAALALDPKSTTAVVGKARLLQDGGDAAGAIALYSKGLETSPGDLNLLTWRGIAYAKSGDQAHADADFTNARTHATSAGVLNDICWTKAAEDVSLMSALADCDAALAMAPATPAHVDSRAFVMLRLGRLDEAIAGYTRAIHMAPRQAASLYGRGVAWSRKGDKAQAAADMAVAMRIDPDIRKRFADYGVQP